MRKPCLFNALSQPRNFFTGPSLSELKYYAYTYKTAQIWKVFSEDNKVLSKSMIFTKVVILDMGKIFIKMSLRM